MAISIVGRDETAVKRITHRECATILEYTESDVINLWSGMAQGV